MSKKRKREARPEPAEVIHARTLREQRWAFDQRRRRLTWGQIADLAIKPPSEGGLGYARSPKALQAAYAVHAAEVQVLEEASRPEATMLMLASLNEKHRALERLAHPVDELRTEQAKRAAYARRDAARAGLIDDDAERKAALALTDEQIEGMVVLRDERIIADAIAKAAAIDRDIARLQGLDAPIAVEVTHNDATKAELEDARARLGIVTPIRKKTKP